eukprot:1247140-Amphidinium_carterae.1
MARMGIAPGPPIRGSAGSAPQAKAMPAQPKAMPRQSAPGASSAHVEGEEPDVDQVLEMKAEENQGNDGDSEE